MSCLPERLRLLGPHLVVGDQDRLTSAAVLGVEAEDRFGRRARPAEEVHDYGIGWSHHPEPIHQDLMVLGEGEPLVTQDVLQVLAAGSPIRPEGWNRHLGRHVAQIHLLHRQRGFVLAEMDSAIGDERLHRLRRIAPPVLRGHEGAISHRVPQLVDEVLPVVRAHQGAGEIGLTWAHVIDIRVVLAGEHCAALRHRRPPSLERT